MLVAEMGMMMELKKENWWEKYWVNLLGLIQVE